MASDSYKMENIRREMRVSFDPRSKPIEYRPAETSATPLIPAKLALAEVN
jgi:hypothetical protein